MNRTLNMAIKTVFFEPVRQGVKKIEYREFSRYWIEKLIDLGSDPIDKVYDGLLDGTYEPKWQGYDRILFHESGGLRRTLLVEMLGVKTYKFHRAFCIQLGKIIKQQNNE